ncbi:adenine nucleotide alpha hydrolases-like protein [Annulohypoxylon nitens]|nr:adenine nucleotide alpha hydrolases-like protein [Annulohypoxylon nitens]
MGTLHHVLHTGARPIGLSEFVDAVRATCPPRFTQRGTLQHRRVAIAVSGGVDSMALAYLCSKVRKFDNEFRVSDNPVNGFRGMVVDHGLREGSFQEATAVCATLEGMGFLTDLIRINWSKVLGNYGDYSHPNELPNLESVARAVRYERLGVTCAFRKLASMFLAHHEDDQYETVLMRLLQGHGTRGLRGIRKAHDIPECEGVFGAHQTGYVDDQTSEYPFYRDRPSAKVRKRLNRALKADIRRLMSEGGADDEDGVEIEDTYHKPPPGPGTIPIEDGGVMVYRPLLEFSKDRLIATCLENNVPWWEDSTNQDATLTTRNAIRKLYTGYTLPKALQKPAVIALAKRSEWRIQAQEAEADRLLRRIIIHDFEPHVGTIVVQFPKFENMIAKRHAQSSLRREARLSRQREIAAIALRKILMLVSPEKQAPHLPTLENHVWRLFPSLAAPGQVTPGSEPKAFNLSGVLLSPIIPDTPQRTSAPVKRDEQDLQQLSWYLSRAPYTSTQPLPVVRTPYWAMLRHAPTFNYSTRMQWALWDNRYWFHAEHRFPYRVILHPFLAAHSKPFRALLPPETRARLDMYLKRFAPGKVRYTLPAIYLEEDLDLSCPMYDIKPRETYPNPISWEYSKHVPGDGEGVGDGRGADRGIAQEGERRDRSTHPRVLDSSKMKLLALPTLDIQIPRLDDWMEYEIRYRKADRKTLGIAGTWDRGSFGTLRKETVVNLRKNMNDKGKRKGKGKLLGSRPMSKSKRAPRT